MKELILGGARSGKSSYAEQQAIASGLDVVYVATATIYDDEMQSRIDHHKQQRPAHWQVLEEPFDLAAILAREAQDKRCLLIDCLTLWITNLLCCEDQNLWHNKRKELLHTLPTLPGRIILVSNEVGMGIVPTGALSRQFVDEAGRLHQDIAAVADKVTFVAAGLPLAMKDTTQS